jgi:cGMP-dependent protein kinase
MDQANRPKIPVSTTLHEILENDAPRTPIHKAQTELTLKDSKLSQGSWSTADPYIEIPEEFMITSTKRWQSQMELSSAHGPDFDPLLIKRNQKKPANRPHVKVHNSMIPIKIVENVTTLHKEKTSEILHFLAQTLKSHFVFSYLDPLQLSEVVSKFKFCQVKKGEFVFKQGDDASLFFILETGKVKVFVGLKEKALLGSGAFFGELALLYNAPRSASVVAEEDCELWYIDRNTFRESVEKTITKQIEENVKFIAKVPLFRNLTLEQQESIAGSLIPHKFNPNTVIVHEDDPADSLYIIKEGNLSVTKQGKEIRKLEQGDTFGEAALLSYGSVRQMTIKTDTESAVVCLALGRESLNAILGDRVEIIVFRNIQRWSMEKNQILSNLTKIQIEKVIDEMTIKKYNKGDVIYENGKKCEKLAIVIEGALIDPATNEVHAAKGTIFGVDSLSVKKMNDKLNASLVMADRGILSEIDFTTFLNVIGGNFEEVIKKNARSHEKKLSDKSNLKIMDYDVPLDNLTFVKKLGAGQFGSVYLVSDEKKDLFALKAISRMKIHQTRSEKLLVAEKQVLAMVDFSYIIKFVRSYKDENNVYFLLEYVKGRELFDAMRDIGYLTTYESQFFIGSLILAIEYMHSQHVVHRDVKPENVMIDHMGFPKLLDMGTCKVLRPGSMGAIARTFTHVGTPLYMAPEIIMGKGYIFHVDLWSLGVMLFEFLIGPCPFGENSEDPYEIYNEILTKKHVFPPWFKDVKAKALIDQMLSRVPEKRLGGSFATLKAHPWFETLDWDKLHDKQLKPPYIPKEAHMISEKVIEEARKAKVPIVKEIMISAPVPKNHKFDLSAQALWDKEF